MVVAFVVCAGTGAIALTLGTVTGIVESMMKRR